jgi:hypothetical protein
MTPVVIDTNVLLVANGSHQDVSATAVKLASARCWPGSGRAWWRSTMVTAFSASI